MSRTITMSIFNPAPWDAMGLTALLDDLTDFAETRFEWPSEHGDSSGEMFAARENWTAPDGRTYHVLTWTYWNSQWAPWTSDSTWATLYDASNPDDVAEFTHHVADWEAKSELDPDYPADEDN